MILQHINDIAAICAAHGISNAIISPGSRSAAISIAFDAHPEINTRVVPDERSAAFIALGLAQQQKKPVVLICTSGSASLNYAPAIAEAYYQEVPLLILTADRPPEWIDQYDGQTINQKNIYGRHVLASFELPVAQEHSDAIWHSNRIINEAILTASSKLAGPVHVNIPIREPFYPEKSEAIVFSKEIRVIKRPEINSGLSEQEVKNLVSRWKSSTNTWIVIGQYQRDHALLEGLLRIKDHAIIINEITGNQHDLAGIIQNQDLLLRGERANQIAPPALLITVGNSLISKNLKIFLRKHPPEAHWHVKNNERLNDGLQGLTESIIIEPSTFFEQLLPNLDEATIKNDAQLIAKDEAFNEKKVSFFNKSNFGELKAFFMLMKALPAGVNLHLANSMTVRYANFVGGLKENIEVFCNRGTSGIDGSNSTAVGAALATSKINVLVTGDLAFFYDRNAFWHHENLNNLRVVVLNNDGGGIFDMIPGPKKQTNHQKLFLTPHGLVAQSVAEEFGFIYHSVRSTDDLNKTLDSFFQASDRPQLIEVFSDIASNTAILEEFYQL